MLRDVGQGIFVSLLGGPLPVPFLSAPIGIQTLCDNKGELAMTLA